MKGGNEMKNNNNLVTTIVVAVIVALVTSLLTVWAMKDSVGLAPTLTKEALALVNAHECRKDGVCEVNDLKAQGAITGTHLSIHDANNGGTAEADIDNLEVNNNLNVEGDLQGRQGTFNFGLVGGYVNLAGNDVYTEGNIPLVLSSRGPVPVSIDDWEGLEITSLTGNGTDYVCVDANGKLFRRNTAS